MGEQEPDGFWRHDPFDSDNQGFFRATAETEPVSDEQMAEFRRRWYAAQGGSPFGPVWRANQPGGFERTPLVSWWRSDKCPRWFCRWPLLCRLARHLREEWTP